MIENWEQYKDLEYYPDRVCACGCGGRIEVKPHHKYVGIPGYLPGHHRRGIDCTGKNNGMYGKHQSEEAIQKIKDSKKGKFRIPKEIRICKYIECNNTFEVSVNSARKYCCIRCSAEDRRGKPSGMKGKLGWSRGLTKETDPRIAKAAESRAGYRHSEETKEKIGKTSEGRVVTKETRKKISEGNAGKHDHHGSNNPMYGKGYKIRGEDNPNWRGGTSNFPYAFEFNEEFKILIRERDNTCQLCGKTKEEEGQNLAVHHIHYDKENICSDADDFVILCNGCNSKVNGNREYWTKFFQQKLSYMDESKLCTSK